MTYAKLKEILNKYPHCFTTVKEKEEEFDRLVASIENRPIAFIRLGSKANRFIEPD